MDPLSNVRANGTNSYSGYALRPSAEIDAELTLTGPGTPGGEYLRRFWHPIAMEKSVGQLPVALQLFGEPLVLFRDGSGRYGLVHRQCPHRLASLEFAMCEENGLRCCYHGWKFDIDGTIIDVPGQPAAAAERIMQKFKLGAYPVKSYKGLLFAYLGPAEQQPPFPIYDAYEIADMEMVPYRAPFHCNWLQVLDAILDPIHTSFLHSRASRVQFSVHFGELGEMAFYELQSRFLGTNARRIGDNVWVRTNEMILPNFTQAGAALATDGTRPRYYGRSSFTRWVVPLNDTETIAIGWANFGERGDPIEWNTPEGIQVLEQGEVFNRPYEERQRFPADSEAVEGMGPITVHRNEHLAPSDRGIMLMRKRLKAEIRAVKEGRAPIVPTDLAANPIPTYGGDTVLHLPRNGSRDDAAYLQTIAKAVLQVQYDADKLVGDARDEQVRAALRRMEEAGAV